MIVSVQVTRDGVVLHVIEPGQFLDSSEYESAPQLDNTFTVRLLTILCCKVMHDTFCLSVCLSVTLTGKLYMSERLNISSNLYYLTRHDTMHYMLDVLKC